MTTQQVGEATSQASAGVGKAAATTPSQTWVVNATRGSRKTLKVQARVATRTVMARWRARGIPSPRHTLAGGLPVGGWVAVGLHVPTDEEWLLLRFAKCWESSFSKSSWIEIAKAPVPILSVHPALEGFWVGEVES